VTDDLTLMEAALVGAADPEIVELESRLRRAQLDADVATLDALIDGDLLFVGPDGELSTKAQDLEAHRSGAVRFRRHVPEALHVRRVREHIAGTVLRARLTVEVAGVEHHGTFSYFRAWLRDAGGVWRVIGGQVSRLGG
jgi:hypothetical protein